MTDEIGGSDGTGRSSRATPVPQDRRIVTVLFADMVRATELTEIMDPEAATLVLLPVVKAMSDAVERYGGSIIKSMGDGLMAVFGIPTVQEDHAIRACLAALAIQTEIGTVAAEIKRRVGAKIEVRVGINSGPVVVATTSDSGHVSYDAMGPTTHLASRMETAAEPGTIALSEQTARRVQHLFECRLIGTKKLKGFNEPQAIYRLIRSNDQPRTKQAPNAMRIASRLVGRTRELRAMKERFEALASVQGSLVLISGEPGIGKTRLLQEARAGLTREVTWLEGHSLSVVQRLSYWPFIEMLKPWLGIHDAKDTEENWKCIEGNVSNLMGDEAKEVMPYLATLLGIELRASHLERVRYLDPESLGAQVMRAVWRLLEHMARENPVVVVIEDLQWIDRSSAALVEHLLPLAGKLPILFCFTSRPEGDVLSHLKGVGQAVPDLSCTEFVLAPLSVEDSQRFIGDIIGDGQHTTRLRDLILDKAEGNPFFAEELIRALIDSKILVHTHTGWEAKDLEIALPDTVQGLIMARVDRLDDRLKQVLGIASVIGRSFFYRVLRVVTEEAEELDERLSTLIAVEIIDELKSAPELTYLFRHALTQEAVYESVLIARRKDIHERVAECIEIIYRERIREVASLLAYHYARAENWEKALKFLVEAADQSGRMAADDEALLHYRDAVNAFSQIFGERWDRLQRAHIELRLGELYLRRSSHADAFAHLVKALSLHGNRFPHSKFGTYLAIGCELVIQLLHRLFSRMLLNRPQAIVDPGAETLFQIFYALAWTAAVLDHDLLVLVSLKLLNHSESSAFAEGISKASAAFGIGLHAHGWGRLASVYHRQAIRVAEELGNPSAIGLAHHLRGNHEFTLGQWDEAMASFDKGRELSRRMGDLSAWSDVSVLKCELLSERGGFDEVLEIAEEMVNLSRESTFRAAYRLGICVKGKGLRRLGRLGECEPLLHEATELMLRTSDFLGLAVAQGELAYLQIERGGYDKARAVLEECRRVLIERRIITFPIIYPYIGLALLGIVEMERTGRQNADTRHEMLRACKNAHRLSLKFQNGLPMSMRLVGTAQWLMGRKKRAEHWWRSSQETAERFGARYQVGLTLVERGRRTVCAEDLEHGKSILESLGIRTTSVDQVPLL